MVALWRPLAATLLDQTETIDGVGPLQAAVDGLPAAPPLDYQPNFVGATATLRIARVFGGSPVELHAFHYAHQHETGEMVHGSNYVVRANDFRSQVVSHTTQEAPWGTIAAYQIRRQGVGSILVWQWYAVGSMQTASAYRAKAATAWSLLIGRGDHSLALVLATPLETHDGVTTGEQLQAATRRLDRLANSLQPAIHDVMEPAAAARP